MALRGLFLAAAILESSTIAIPTIAFPLNSQVPPAARLSTPFSYTFPSSTFSSDSSMTYTLSSGPRWLSLDSDSRTLFGTPSTSDVGADIVTGVPIGLTATDSTGSTTLNATLVISKNPAPSISIPVIQLQLVGAFSTPSTLLYHPSTQFNFKLDPGTFSNNGSAADFSYYAITTNNTPLPSWIQFDGSSLTFSGQTPDYQSLIQPPQTFGIQLIASDIEGFGGTSMFFDIEVGVHLLAFKNADVVINATGGDIINFDGLSGNLELDGQTPKLSDIVAATAQTPSWMVFDNSTLRLNGTLPEDATSTNITIQATDIHGDTADAIVRIVIVVPLFSKSIGNLNATIGSTFSYDLGIYLSNRSDTNLNAQISPTQTWLSFNPQTFILAGQIPPAIQASAIGIKLSATSKSSNIVNSESFRLLLVASNRTSSTSSFSSTPTSYPSQTSEAPTASKITEPTVTASSSHNRLSTKVILAISIPLGVLFIALLLTLCCYCQRRRAAKKQKAFGKLEKRAISSPLEAKSSVEEVIRPSPLIPVPPPRPLQLDMSGFGTPSGARPGAVLGPISGAETTERERYPKRMADNPLRRSKTMSDPRLSQLIDSRNSGFGNRRRSKSDNALSNSENSWRYTLDSAYPDLRSSGTSSSQTQPLTRNYSNYSRKGHVRRSAMVSLNPPHPVRESDPPRQRPKSTILNLRDSNFSLTPLDSFSALQSQVNIQEVSDAIPSLEEPVMLPRKSSKRQSRFMPTMDRPRGIGHGRQESISSSSGVMKRRSVGHGQDWQAGRGLARDSRTWLTVATSLEKRQSTASASSTYDEPKRVPFSPRKTIRQVTKSPSIHHPSALSESSGNSRVSRPVSRRTGSSPFFGGSSTRSSHRITKNSKPLTSRTSYADSPTVPEEAVMDNLEETIAQGLREMSDETDERDSFGISYGLAREGTRQLRSYIQSHLGRSRTRSSLVSNESRDSRFDSAASISQMERSPEREQQQEAEREYEFEDYLPDGFSEGSWETQRSARDEEGNTVMDAMVERNPGAEIGNGAGYGNSKSTPSSPEVGRAARIVRGAGRRPLSVDARTVTRVGTQRGEMDYTAYI